MRVAILLSSSAWLVLGAAGARPAAAAGPARPAGEAELGPGSRTPAAPRTDAAVLAEIRRARPGFQRHRLAGAWMAELTTPAQMAARFPALARVDDPAARQALLAVFFERYVDLDPVGALSFLEAHLSRGDPLYRPVLVSLFQGWLDLDPRAATARLARIPSVWLRTAVVRALLQGAERDAATTEALLAGLDEEQRDAIRVEKASATEPRAAFLAALAQAPGDLRAGLLRSAFIRWVSDAPAEALSQIDQIPVDQRREVVTSALTVLAEERPDQVLGYLGGLTDDYATCLASVLGVLARTRPELALDWAYRNQWRDPRAELFSAVVPHLLRTDLDLAARVVASLQDHAPVALVEQVAVEYARDDPQRAYDWVNQVAANRRDNGIMEILGGLSARLAEERPEEAVDYLRRVADPDVKSGLIREISRQKGEQDLRSAWDWLSQYRGEESYKENARNLLYRWSYARPEEVAAVLNGVGDEEVQAAAARQLAYLWQQRDSRAYEAWLAGLPPGPLRSAVLAGQD